jgi:sulfopyruvate decarboxylase alpha subunit
LVGYVPDAGHKRLIELCQADGSMRAVPLTTEEEGVGLALGAWLGGARTALLLQSSGVGNMVNVLGTVRECRLPFLMIVTMRGEEGEFNPWQVPMGSATPKVLEAMGVRVRRAEEAGEVATVVQGALNEVYEGDAAVAVLISQAVIGIKSFQEQRDR